MQQDGKDTGNTGRCCARWKIEVISAPHAPPMEPQINTLMYRRLTPKIAGSVMPIIQDSAAGNARERIF